MFLKQLSRRINISFKCFTLKRIWLLRRPSDTIVGTVLVRSGSGSYIYTVRLNVARRARKFVVITSHSGEDIDTLSDARCYMCVPIYNNSSCAER